MKSGWKRVLTACAGAVGAYVLMNTVAKKVKEDTDMDNEPCMILNCQVDVQKGQQNENKGRTGAYEGKVKPMIDRLLSFLGLLFLGPVFVIISLAIVINDPGPVLFTQKRVGKDKQFFMLHKFRSMKMKTPHDVPTHQLENPEQYITRIGKFLRKYSLDELPQIWDIFRGKMSIIGPRPALWNQDDLVAERDKYGANNILPGLTGWAQINGRDELEIADKARLDGEYAVKLRQGGMMALFFDVKCFLGTVASVLKHDGVVEGGTGASNKNRDDIGDRQQENHTYVGTVDKAKAGFEDYGHRKVFHIDKTLHKHILITGANSYIGGSFASYAKEHYPNLAIDTIDMIDGSWREYDFTPYDAVFHVAGIAHADVGKVSETEQEKYYKVNTDLAIECCRKAKNEDVKQFIFMSSMIIYGSREYIDDRTVPVPDNFYGNSKWLADKGVRELADNNFHVAVLRPPMIYGRGSKGNYPTLVKLARKLPVFPDVDNKRSMLYIENLCEFVVLLVLSGEGGVYFPQNREYSKTSEIVSFTAEESHHTIAVTKLLFPAVKLASCVPGKVSCLTDKAFGNQCYDQKLSQYTGFSYQKVSLRESITRMERVKKPKASRLITIITVCYNSADVIEKTIQSVLHQTYDYIEYLIIDGASTDKTVLIAGKYETLFKERGYGFAIISGRDKGIYDAMNKGIKHASGELIGFINAGDWYEKDAVEIVAEEYEAEPYDYIYGDVNLIKPDGRRIVKHSREDRIITSRHWNHPSSFCTRRLYEQIGFFRCEGIHDDFEFFLRVRKSNSKIRIVNKVLANFVTGGASNVKSFSKSIQRIKDRYVSYRRNEYSPLYLIECIYIEIAKAIIS